MKNIQFLIVGIIVAIIISGVYFLRTGPSEAGEKTITITDMAGRTVAVPQDVERVATVMPPCLRVVVALGCAERVVGVSGYVESYGNNLAPVLAHPELRNLPKIFQAGEINLEELLIINPDVVFVPTIYSDLASLIQEQTGIPAVCLDFVDYPMDIRYEAFRLAGKILGKEEEAENLVSYMKELLDQVKGVTLKIPDEEKVRVYLAGFWGCRDVQGTETHYAPLEIAGGINVAGNAPGEHPEVSKEQIVEWDPDVIFTHGSSWPPPNDVLTDPALQTVKAVKNGKVYPSIGQFIFCSTADMIVETHYMAKLLYPENFDYGMEEIGNQVLKRFFGVDNLYNILDTNRGLNLYRWE